MPRYMHAMIRVSDPDASIAFFELLGLREVKRTDYPKSRYSLILLGDPDNEAGAQIELAWTWDKQGYERGDNFGHLAFRVENIYALCQRMLDAGVVINRPPRDGYYAFVCTPDGIAVELVQDGRLPPQEPWASMKNTGSW